MWRIGLIVFGFLVLTASAVSSHELIFNLQHRHDSHYYENIYYQERQRAIRNYYITGQPRYMVPYLGWPKNNGKNKGESTTIYWSGSRSSRQR